MGAFQGTTKEYHWTSESSTGTRHPSGCKGGLVEMNRKWSDYLDDEPLPDLVKSGLRTQDSDLMCDGSIWIKVPMALRTGTIVKPITVWVMPKNSFEALDSLTDSGRSDSDSEYSPE
jgi:hypothetical protein